MQNKKLKYTKKNSNNTSFSSEVDYFLPIEVPKKCQYSFQTIFSYVKKSLRIKNTRKSNIDSLLKKSKGKFCKAVHDSLKLCLNLLVKRLPQKFITNITIEFNQKFLGKRLFDIYDEYHLLPSKAEVQEKNLYRKDKSEVYEGMIESSFEDLYEIYLKSKRFEKDLRRIQAKEGKKNEILYEFVAKNFVKYYIYNKAHALKAKEEKRTIFLVNYNHCSNVNLFD